MQQDLSLSPEFKMVGRSVVEGLPKVLLNHPVSVSADTVGTELDRLASEGVVYVELRVPACDKEQLRALIDSAAVAESRSGITARLVLSADRARDSQEVASLAVVNRGPVVGVAIEGHDSEELDSHADTLRFLKANFMPVTVLAGTTAGLDSLHSAVTYGADRLSGAIQLYEDFTVDLEGIAAGPLAAHIRDREVPLELALSADVDRGLVEEVGDHPIQLLQQLGFTCTLNPLNHSITDEMMLLVEGFDYGLEELFELTINAMEAAFAPIELRRGLMHDQIIPAYQKFADLEDQLSAAEESEEEPGSEGSDSGLTISGLE